MADLELVLEMLRRMQGDLRDIKDTLREHTRRLGHIELNTAQQTSPMPSSRRGSTGLPNESSA